MPTAKKAEKYAICPICSYKNTVTITGSEGFQSKTFEQVIFPCLSCGAPLAPHEDKESFDKAPIAPSQSQAKFRAEHKILELGDGDDDA